jgi:RNA polymerase sigma-70 factor (ECF subfamily)
MARKTGFFVEVDENLLGRARRGELAALETVYDLFSVPVYNLGRRLSASAVDAEDILQDTFLELVRSIGSYRGEGAFGAWLRRITVSKALMRRRRSNVRRMRSLPAHDEQLPETGSLETAARDCSASCDLERALASLSETSRTVVWLHDVEGLTHAEIAALFDRSVSFSKSQLSRAHDQLRRWFGEREGVNHASNDERAVGAAGR